MGAPPRIDFAPLERFVLLSCDDEIVTDPTPKDRLGTGHPSTVRVAAELGCWPRSIERWRRRGIPVWEADRLATRCGQHPAAIWGAEWCDAIDALLEDLDDAEADEPEQLALEGVPA